MSYWSSPSQGAVIEGAVQVSPLDDGVGIEVVSGSAQGAFAVGFPMDAGRLDGAIDCVQIDMEVLADRIGLGCLSRDREYDGVEHEIPAGGRQAIHLAIPEPERLGRLIVRISPEGPSRSCASMPCGSGASAITKRA